MKSKPQRPPPTEQQLQDWLDLEKLVRQFARRYKRYDWTQRIDYNDLIQEGFLGIVKARTNFDGRFNAKFSTYAYYCIRTCMLRHCYKMAGALSTPADRPTSPHEKESFWRSIRATYLSMLGHGHARYRHSDDVLQLKDKHAEQTLDRLPEFHDGSAILDYCCETLELRHLDILYDWLENNNLAQLAREQNVSRERIRQIKSRTLIKLKEKFAKSGEAE